MAVGRGRNGEEWRGGSLKAKHLGSREKSHGEYSRLFLLANLAGN